MRRSGIAGGLCSILFFVMCLFLAAVLSHVRTQAQTTTFVAPPIVQQFFNVNGIPIIGGKLCSYIGGTLTPQATYTDSTGSTQNPNPLVLDSGGRAAPGIWLKPSLLYKFILYDNTGTPNTCNGNQIWSIDNVSVPQGGTAAVGTVTSVCFAGDGTLLAAPCSVPPVTSSGPVFDTLAQAAKYTVWGNPTNATATPIYTTNPIVSTIGVAGSSSGVAVIGAAAAAGTPAQINLPTSTAAAAGQVFTSDANSPQQTSWAYVTKRIAMVYAGAAVSSGSCVAASAFDIPVTGGMSPVCGIVGTNGVAQGELAAADGDVANYSIGLPSDFVSLSGAETWLTSTDTTPGDTIKPTLATSCTATTGLVQYGSVAFNTAQNFSTITIPSSAANPGAYFSTIGTLTGTGCAANSILNIELSRTTDTASNAQFTGWLIISYLGKVNQ